MLLTAEELAQYRADGFLVVPCPWPADLTRAALTAYERRIGLPATAPATAHELAALPDKVHQFRLADPWAFGSLDHSLPMLRMELHPDVCAFWSNILCQHVDLRVQ
jgi:hypothetical protein